MWQSVEILNAFNTSTLKKMFCKTKTFFIELEHRFLVESNNIENTFPYKTDLSEAYVKTNKTMSTKWTYHKERSFASNLVLFHLQFKNLL